MTSPGTTPEPAAAVGAFAAWIQQQSLKSAPIPNYEPDHHLGPLAIIEERLLLDHAIASGKLSTTLREILADPTATRRSLTDAVFNGNDGYALQILWPLVSLFAGRMPQKVSRTTAQGYLGWLNRIERVVTQGLEATQSSQVSAVIDALRDAYQATAGGASGETGELAREAELATERVNTNAPGIYVFTTPTYLAYPPFGWNAEDLARQDFRYLKTGSTSIDVGGRIQSEIRRQTGLPEPYVILAKFRHSDDQADYGDMERRIHFLLGEARHGPEEDGTRRSSSRGAGTEWFITRLPFVIALATSLGLHLDMTEDLKVKVNEFLEACELPDWILA